MEIDYETAEGSIEAFEEIVTDITELQRDVIEIDDQDS